ncbi:MAG TPA: hypothetical protein DDW71_11000 [Lactobacillus sp.]|nr:hypothetical protein [Lactobacillus sp.]
MTKSLGSFKIRQVGNSLVITIPKNALANKDEELNLYQNENGDLVYQHPHKSNPNPWDIVSYDDIDLYEANSQDLKKEWLKKHKSIKEKIKFDRDNQGLIKHSPKLGSIVLVEDREFEFKNSDDQDSSNPASGQSIFIVMSKSGFNESMPFFYGFQIHPFAFNSQFLGEPSYEAYVDKEHGINGTIDKMQLEKVMCGSCTLITQLPANILADLQFDLRNIFDMN